MVSNFVNFNFFYILCVIKLLTKIFVFLKFVLKFQKIYLKFFQIKVKFTKTA